MKQYNNNFLILIIGLIGYSIFHILGNYGYKFWEKSNKPVWFIMFFGLLFGFLSFVIKVPLFYYFAKENIIVTAILDMVIFTLVLILYSKFVLNETVKTHTYLSLFLIVLILCINEYLNINFRTKKI